MSATSKRKRNAMTMMRMEPDGSQPEIFARGIRNTVGFAWNPPETGELWFTDNGRDWLGDDLPPDELNSARARDALWLSILPWERYP